MNENSLKNLRPIELSHDEAVANGRKGGIASGKARKGNRIIKDAILEQLDDERFNEIINRFISRATYNTRDFMLLLDILGQRPNDKASAYNEQVQIGLIAKEVEAIVLKEQGGNNGSISDN